MFILILQNIREFLHAILVNDVVVAYSQGRKWELPHRKRCGCYGIICNICGVFHDLQINEVEAEN